MGPLSLKNNTFSRHYNSGTIMRSCFSKHCPFLWRTTAAWISYFEKYHLIVARSLEYRYVRKYHLAQVTFSDSLSRFHMHISPSQVFNSFALQRRTFLVLKKMLLAVVVVKAKFEFLRTHICNSARRVWVSRTRRCLFNIRAAHGFARRHIPLILLHCAG